MFRKKSSKNYKEVRLSCPFCGAAQDEPALAISSFCRSCGEHFRIEKGVAVAPPGAHVSGISPIARNDSTETNEDRRPAVEFPAFDKRTVAPPKDGPPPGKTWLRAIRERAIEERKAAFSEKTQRVKLKSPEAEAAPTVTAGPPADSVESKEARVKGKPSKKKPSKKGPKKKAGKAARKSARKPKQKAPAVPAPETESRQDSEPAEATKASESEEVARDPNDLGAAAQPVEQLKGGSMAALLGGALEKLKTETRGSPETPNPAPPKMPRDFVPSTRRKAAPGPRMRPVRCFECNHLQKVSASATSTQCARCSVYIRLIDHEISSPWSQNIQTRGNVHVHRKGSVSGCDIACHNLVVQGKFSASVDCSGDAVFKHSAKVIGNIHCKHLVVEKKCDVDFPQGVIAESADVFGTVRGDMTCSGRIRIFKNGSVIGDATARAVVLNDGGVLTGKMSIQPDLEIVLPEKKGYLNQ